MTDQAQDVAPIPISLVAHTVFCPRRAWLEAAGETTDTDQVTAGVLAHRRVDTREGRNQTYRAVDIYHSSLGLTGRCDHLSVKPDGTVKIIEYKATPVRRRPDVTEAMRIQLALQLMCLKDMGIQASGQAVHFVSHHTTVGVTLSGDDLELAKQYVHRTRQICESPTAPEPLEDDPRCTRCSHIDVCLPEETRRPHVQRHITVSDPDCQVVHLATPGSRASLSKGRMIVRSGGDELATLPIERVQGLVVHGNVDLSSALIREMCWRGLTIVWCSGTGRVSGWSRSAHSANGLQRVRQHEASAQGRLGLARALVSAKIRNQATLLRRSIGSTDTVKTLRASQKAAESAQTIDQLRGIEGHAAAVYFSMFPAMLSAEKRADFVARWPGRNGRGATDPLNAALNFVYGVLTTEAIRAIAACGLDPHAGFLHSSTRNKPALALDLMEEFRAPIADSVVVRAINNGELTTASFSDALGSCRLTEKGRKKLIAGFEQRIQTKFRHPVVNYTTTWRRAMEIQARMILKYIDGSQSRYVGIATR